MESFRDAYFYSDDHRAIDVGKNVEAVLVELMQLGVLTITSKLWLDMCQVAWDATPDIEEEEDNDS